MHRLLHKGVTIMMGLWSGLGSDPGCDGPCASSDDMSARLRRRQRTDRSGGRDLIAHPCQVASWLPRPPTARHLGIVQQLLAPLETGGNLVNDTHLAALAIEHRCTVVSYDTDFLRFPGVKLETPADETPADETPADETPAV